MEKLLLAKNELKYNPSIEKINNSVDESFSASQELNKLRLTSALDVENIYKIKHVYAIVTYISYPAGGGESFLYQTLTWARNIGLDCVWISFKDMYTGLYKQDIIEEKNQTIFHKVSGDFSIEKLKECINKYKPDILHISGSIIFHAFDYLLSTRIPMIIGYHFWLGLVKLDEKLFNKDIIKNRKFHILNNFYIKNLENPLIQQYVASDFMNDVLETLGGPKIKNVIYPVSLDKEFLTEYNVNAKYVTIINLNKGTDLITEIIKNCNDVKFLAINNEQNESIAKNVKTIRNYINGQFHDKYIDVKEVYSKTKIILIPSDVDETFCRVAYETAKCGIPIITTGKGYIKQLLGDAAIYLTENYKDWIENIRELYNNHNKLLKISERLKQSVSKYGDQEYNFRRLMLRSLKNTPSRNIMIFCPWCDQGLGIQSRSYCNCLLEHGFNVHIFSYMSYFFRNQDKSEWLNYSSIYTSYNDRENVTLDELKHFVLSKNIGICIIPEICFKPLYEKVKLLKGLNVKCFAIPNIETCRKSELINYKLFDKVLCNTQVCQNILSKYINNLHYIGHFCEPIKSQKNILNELKFLHVAGYNSMTRKQTLKVLDSFFIALRYTTKISLTVTFSSNMPDEVLNYKHDNLKIISSRLSHKEIIKLYKSHHVSIQVGSHEGLGLGFYESISCSTPVITMNCPPHNEIIKDYITGWLIPCTEIPLIDNNEALVNAYTFKNEDLSDKILELAMNDYIVKDVIIKTREEVNKWNKEDFCSRLISALY